MLQRWTALSSILVAESNLVYSPEEIDHPTVSFKAEFLHHFIEDEIIRGYEEPHLDFYFAPLTMDCYFKYTCKSRTRESINLETIFEPFFINGLIHDRKIFEEKLGQQSAFNIPAKLIGQVTRQESVFDTYLIEDITEPQFNHYMKNLQIFLKFFIETGSYVDDTDPIWKHIIMIERVYSFKQENFSENICWLRFILPFLQRT